MALRRDSYFIICQHNLDYPLYSDGGDSVRSTALMAMAGSELDKSLIEDFVVVQGTMTDNPTAFHYIVRHPYQTSNGETGDKFRNWTDPRETSRDQVLCASGAANKDTVKLNKALLNYAKMGKVNKDILASHHKLTLCLAGGETNIPFRFKLFGYPLMLLHVLYTCFVVPDEETNQTISMLKRFPRLEKLFYKLHPDIEGNIKKYFCGKPWRNQDEIAEALIKYVRSKK